MDFCFVSCVYFGQSAEAAAAYARRMNLAYWMTDVVEKIFGLLVFSSKFCQVWKSRKKYPLSMKRKTRADLVKQHEVKPKCKYHIWVGCCCKKKYIYIYFKHLIFTSERCDFNNQCSIRNDVPVSEALITCSCWCHSKVCPLSIHAITWLSRDILRFPFHLLSAGVAGFLCLVFIFTNKIYTNTSAATLMIQLHLHCCGVIHHLTEDFLDLWAMAFAKATDYSKCIKIHWI